MNVQHTVANAPRVPAVDLFESSAALKNRTFKVPDIVGTEPVEADATNGVLTLTLPMVAAARPRKLAVTTAG